MPPRESKQSRRQRRNFIRPTSRIWVVGEIPAPIIPPAINLEPLEAPLDLDAALFNILQQQQQQQQQVQQMLQQEVFLPNMMEGHEIIQLQELLLPGWENWINFPVEEEVVAVETDSDDGLVPDINNKQSH